MMMKKHDTGKPRSAELRRRASERGEELVSLAEFRPAPPDAPRSLEDIPEQFRKPARPPGKGER